MHKSLPIIYRETPKDIDYKVAQEFTYCERCKYFQFSRTYYSKKRWCNFPWELDVFDVDIKFLCREMNRLGSCKNYDPTLWIRFWRIFGFYKKRYGKQCS